MASGFACGCVAGGGASGWLAWGRQGVHRDGEFNQPRAVYADRGEVYVVDQTGRVQVFTEQGQPVRMWRLPAFENGTPTAIIRRGEGRVLVPDTHYSRILEYAPEGELMHQWGEYGTGENQFIYPTDLALAPDGSYFISEYGVDAERVHVFDKDRRFVRQWGSHGEEPGQFSRLMAIDIGDGTVFVCDTANNRVQCFTFEGELLRVIGGAGAGPGQLRYPYDIEVAPDGSLLVCEYGNNRISRFTAAGEFLTMTGRAGRRPGEFHAPRGVSVDSEGFVYVADTGNHRIQRFPWGELA